MRYKNTLLALGLIASSVHAGTPDNDLVIQDLRNEFEQAAIPSPADLHPDFDWSCDFYKATGSGGTSDPIYNHFKFTGAGGRRAIVSAQATRHGILVDINAAVFTSRGLIGSKGLFGIAFRILKDGSLIGEISSALEPGHAPSIVEATKGARYYGYCAFSQARHNCMSNNDWLESLCYQKRGLND